MADKADPLTFDEVYAKYADRVLNLLFRFTANEELARDLTQEVFIKVYENLEGFEHRSQIYSWIYRIAVNHATNHLKKERRNRWVNLLDKKISDVIREDDIDPAFWGRSTATESDRDLEREQRARIVWAAVQSLSPKYRVPLVLSLYEGLSYKDIAAAMEISMATVESRIYRAKKQLVKKLKPWVEEI